MAFVNYKVDLVLKDGTKSTGRIIDVNKEFIRLENVIHNSSPDSVIPSVKHKSSELADLTVVGLPLQGAGKSSKKNGLNNKQSQSLPGQPQGLLDDAIIFAKAPSPANTSANSVREGVLATPKSSSSFSRSSTPKVRTSKLGVHPSSDSTDTWGNGNDVKDIKASNEFDFEANLAMFDKRSVFADFQKKDNINPMDRLVSNNKVDSQTKNAKFKKEKYDNDEMVLNPNQTDNWENIGSKKYNKKEAYKDQSDYSHTQRVVGTSQSIKLVDEETKNPIPMASPVQLVEIERLSSDSYGISPEIMAEVCASHLSQLINNKILGGSVRLSNKKNHNLPPLVLLLIGNARCGNRALATGRHLTNHGVRVLAFVINPEEKDRELSHQWNLFEKCDGKIVTSDFNELLDVLKYQLESPVELIVDALQGYDDHLEDIFYQESDQKVLAQLIRWCNQDSQTKKVLSLEIPSGIDGGSGTISDSNLLVRCNWCVSLGFPITGLVHAYKNGHIDESEVSHYLLDIGYSNKVFRTKGSLRKFDRFWFNADASIKLVPLLEE